MPCRPWGAAPGSRVLVPGCLGVVAVACASGLEVRRSVVVGQAQKRVVAPRSTPWARGGHVDPVGGRVRLAVLPDPLRSGLAFGNGAPRGRHVSGFPGGQQYCELQQR